MSKGVLAKCGIALIITCGLFFFSQQPPFQRLEAAFLDMHFLLRGATPFNEKIVIIEIDDANIDKVGRWPWKRDWHGAITRALSDLGANSIFFDVIFSEPSTDYDDTLFAEAIKEAGNVYLPFAFSRISESEDVLLGPIETFSTHIKNTGSINIYPDRDGVLRRVPLLLTDSNKKQRYHMALRIASDYLGVELKSASEKNLLLQGKSEKRSIPLIEDKRMLINWHGRWAETFRHYSFLQVLNTYKELLDGKTPSIDPEEFKDSICLIGITALGLYDIKAVPLEAEYPALGIVATSISNIVNGDFLISPPGWVKWLLVYELVLIPFLLVGGAKPLRRIFAVLGCAIIFFMLSFLLFKKGIYVDCSLPLVAYLGSYLGITAYKFLRLTIDNQRFFNLSITDDLTGLYNMRYFEPFLRNEIRSAQNNTSTKFCVLMGDIDHFKRVNDTYGHRLGSRVLQEVARVMRDVVADAGIVARYGGEEFIIFLNTSYLPYSIEIADRIRKRIERLSTTDGEHTCKITISWGSALVNSTDDVNSLIKRADKGLYKAKNRGKNTVDTIEDIVTN